MPELFFNTFFCYKQCHCGLYVSATPPRGFSCATASHLSLWCIYDSAETGVSALLITDSITRSASPF